MIGIMSRKRPKQPGSGDKAGQSSDRHRHPLLSFRPVPDLRDALQSLADQQRRSLSQMVVLLLEEALTAKGLWPPQAPPTT